MSERSISRTPAVLAALALASALGACSQGPSEAYRGPGWYLQRPYIVIAGGPAVVGGPFSYDECEAQRMKLSNSENYLCSREIKRPQKFGIQ
jgi:hypothetical protein